MASKELPSDLVFDIISRTPSLETLDVCKTVSKEWNRMIYETNFMPLYCHRTKNVSGYFVQDVKHCEYFSQFFSFDEKGGKLSSFGMFPKGTRILASCRQGILCCVKREDKKYRYCVCKPTTGQWQSLPNPRRHCDTVGVAIVVVKSSPDLRYKIVRLSSLCKQGSMKGNYSYRCDMLDSKTWKWRKIGDVVLSYLELIIRSTPSTSVANSIYWLTSEDNVLQICLGDESFDKFSIPEHVQNNNGYKCKRLVEYQGNLGFICMMNDDNYMELWLRENNMSWRKIMVVDIRTRVEKHAFLGGFYNAGIVFLEGLYEVMFYKLQDCSLSRVKMDDLIYAREVFPFRSDFKRVDLGRNS